MVECQDMKLLWIHSEFVARKLKLLGPRVSACGVARPSPNVSITLIADGYMRLDPKTGMDGLSKQAARGDSYPK